MLNQCLMQCQGGGRVDFTDQTTGKLVFYSSNPCSQPNTILLHAAATNHPIGRLVLRQANILGVVYVLYGIEADVALAVLHYMMPSSSCPRNRNNNSKKKVLRMLPTRIARIALPRSTTASSLPDFEAAAARCIRRGDTLANSSLLRVLHNRLPHHSNGKQWTLAMEGRGRVSSNKNMVLVEVGDLVMLRMAAWDTHLYHVDYDAQHVTPILAFAFALAQLDL